jgi:hypothetical protein
MRRRGLQGKPASNLKETTMPHAPLSPEQEWKYAETSLSWHGWGSPVGLGIAIMSLGIAAVLFRLAISGL